MSAVREFKESEFYQGEDEILAYLVTTTPWASSPTSPTVKLFSYDPDADTYTDVSATKLVGTATVAGDVITTPAVTSLTAGTKYRLEVKFVVSGNTFEGWGWIQAER